MTYGDFSRFGRNSIEVGYYIEQIFPVFKTRFISVSDNYDSDNYKGDTGGLGVAVNYLVHEYYSRDLSKKVKTAIHGKMKRGEYISKNCVFGYIKGDDRQLKIDEPAAETIRLIFALAAKGMSVADIAKHLYNAKCPTPSEYNPHPHIISSLKADEEILFSSVAPKKFGRGLNQEQCKKMSRGDNTCLKIKNLWHKSTIISILSDEQYVGTYVAGKSKQVDVGSGKKKRVDESEWIKIPNHHPAIVDRALFDKAREEIHKKTPPIRKREIGTAQRYADAYNSPLKGKVVCGSCGHVMKLSLTKNSVFHCQYSFAAPDVACHSLKILESELRGRIAKLIHDKVRSILDTDLEDKKNMQTVHSAKESEMSGLIAEYEAEKKKLFEMFALDELALSDYMAQKAELNAKIQLARQERNSHFEKTNETIKRCADETAILRAAGQVVNEQHLSRDTVELLIDRVTILPDGHFDIKWKGGNFVAGA